MLTRTLLTEAGERTRNQGRKPRRRCWEGNKTIRKLCCRKEKSRNYFKKKRATDCVKC